MRIGMVGRPLPIERHASRSVDQPVDHHFGARRIVPDRDVECAGREGAAPERRIVRSSLVGPRLVGIDEGYDAGWHAVTGQNRAHRKLAHQVFACQALQLICQRLATGFRCSGGLALELLPFPDYGIARRDEGFCGGGEQCGVRCQHRRTHQLGHFVR